VARYWVDTRTFKIFFFKFKKNSEKSRSDTWHTPGLTRVHLKKFKKIQKIQKKNSKKIQKL